MRPRPRLVVTDLDGTLLTSEKRVSASTVCALTKARAIGLHLAIATARPYRLVHQVVPPEILTLFCAAIVSNGAAVVRPRDQQVLHENLLPANEAKRVIDQLRAHWPSAGFGWESGQHFSSDRILLQLAETGTVVRDPHPDRLRSCPAGGIHQLVMAVPNSAPSTLLDPAAAILGTGYTVTDSLGGVVEISTAYVNKASGAQWWAHSHQATLADAIAFGDEHNDLPLLTRVGTGVAMANATNEVKAAAAVTTLSNDQNGVAVALRQLIFDDPYHAKNA